MNFNILLECAHCERQAHCRVGMSNRDYQPLKFSCAGCGSPIGVTYSGTNLRSLTCEITGAKERSFDGPDESYDFVDLHLDFPVVFGPYEMGFTAFMRALSQVGADNAAFHRHRLRLIDDSYRKYPQVERLVDMFLKGHFGPFIEHAQKRLKINTATKRPEDLNATLYTAISKYVLPYTLPDTSQAAVKEFSAVISRSLEYQPTQMYAFLGALDETKFLQNAQRDCLRIYKPFFAAELPLRPALYLDLDPSYREGLVAMRVSTNEFDDFRELYRDMAELLSRLLVVVAGINNLIKRGDHDAFLLGAHVSKKGAELAPKSLDAFADVPLGRKLDFLDDPWTKLSPGAHDNELRNAIAHSKIEYDDLTQRVTYFPKLEGMAREVRREMFLIDYMCRTLALFREVHRFHHLIKCLNYALLLAPKPK